MLMNESDIDDAVRRWSYDPVLGPAARTLASLRDAVNRNSDGWCYWRKPSNASRMLQSLLSEPPTNRDVIREAYKRSLTPIKAFRTRSGIEFEIYDAQRDDGKTAIPVRTGFGRIR